MRIPITLLAAFSILIAAASASTAANVCSSRIPDNAILLFDQYPGMAVIKPTLIAGAPNFREVGADPVYGTAQPTVAGLEGILSAIDAPRKPVLWLNLREEPVLYINGRPYSYRDPADPFANLIGVTSTAEKVRQVEECLKTELIQNAAQHNGMVDLYGEPHGKVVDLPEKMESVETVSEVFADMRSKGFKIDFRRIPVEDDQAPTLDAVHAILKAYSETTDTTLVANCQAGKGRTTTALALFYIGNGMDADASIDKVGAAQNLRTVIQDQKSPAKKQNFQARYDLLKFVAGQIATQGALP